MISTRVPLVIAHRGESVLAPENTIKACQLALEQGATALEIDVRPCGTGEIVLFHDNLLNRHFGKLKPVAFCSLQELRSLEFSRQNYKYPAKTCTLAEFFEEFKDKVPVNLDVKTRYTSNKLFAKSLIHEIDSFNMNDQVWISSFNPFFLKTLKSFKPSVRTGYLFRNIVMMHRIIDILLQSDAWHPHYSVITDRFFEMAKKLQKEIYVWTINEESILNNVLKYNFEGIITDTLFRNLSIGQATT